MADNTRLNLGSGGDLIRTEDVGGAYKITVSKVYLGEAGVDAGPVTVANPMPVIVTGMPPLTGVVEVSNPLNVFGSVVVSDTVNVSGAVSVIGPVEISGATQSVATTGVVQSGTAAVPTKHAAIAASSPGLNTIVAAVPGKSIRVLQYLIIATGSVAVEFRSGTSDALTGPMSFAANTGAGAAASALGHFATASGSALTLHLSGATSVSGHLTYIEV